jgi:hypothetical protein
MDTHEVSKQVEEKKTIITCNVIIGTM